VKTEMLAVLLTEIAFFIRTEVYGVTHAKILAKFSTPGKTGLDFMGRLLCS